MSVGVVTWEVVDSELRQSPVYSYLDTHTDPDDKVEYFYALQWLAKKASFSPYYTLAVAKTCKG
jgi:hypothetical protein